MDTSNITVNGTTLSQSMGTAPYNWTQPEENTTLRAATEVLNGTILNHTWSYFYTTQERENITESYTLTTASLDVSTRRYSTLDDDIEDLENVKPVAPYSTKIETTILAVTLAIAFVFLLFIVALLYIKRHRAGLQWKPPGEWLSTCDNFRGVELQKFREHVEHKTKDSGLEFAEEFELLSEQSPSLPKTAARQLENHGKNRFLDILPYDSTRVKLVSTEDDTDYINANYMLGYNSDKEFIVAQGPLPHTRTAFWKMIWEQEVNLIVMLTRCVENHRIKCSQYWPEPDQEPLTYGNIKIELASKSSTKICVVRNFLVIQEDTHRLIKQMHFTAWPDHGSPKTTKSLLEFIKKVRESNPPGCSQAPILVHCSAGVGRTGTFICVDRLLQHIREHRHVDIFGTILEMRHWRSKMVQTENQYIFIHKCIEDVLVETCVLPKKTIDETKLESGTCIYNNSHQNGPSITPVITVTNERGETLPLRTVSSEHNDYEGCIQRALSNLSECTEEYSGSEADSLSGTSDNSENTQLVTDL